MAQHHEGAIEMAETVFAEGENPKVAQLANDMLLAQQTEIQQMAGWRAAWS